MGVNEASVPASATEAELALLLGLQQRCMQALDSAELGFVIANETWQLLPYSQACVFFTDNLGRPALRCVSGLTAIQEETPFTLWVGRVSRALDEKFKGSKPERVSVDLLESHLQDSWVEWWPDHVVWIPITGPQGHRAGSVILVRESAWSDAELQRLTVLMPVWGYCAHALQRKRGAWSAALGRLRHSRVRQAILLSLVLLMAVPVRLSALAPAEIIALQAEAVSAPMEGVIKTFHVAPNTVVHKGDLLFSLDETTLRNRREVSRKALAVARAEALAGQQKSFDNVQSRADLASLAGRVREKEAELAYLDESLTRVDVKAALDGVFVYGDPNDWLGKPVSTGERVGQLAQPDGLGVMMWLPVGDAINLEPGAQMRVYLQVSPLTSLSAELVQTSYQAVTSPDGVVSYRIRGQLHAHDKGDARIGLRGVAKVYGEWRPLIYWILRRPVGVLRQWVGV